ncbi:MAG: NUDIX domain-containing protein [bacterium]|nr:NUDIX domain-containing protein [bacterium]
MENSIVKQERFKLIPSVYVFLVKENKILLLRRFQTGYEDGKYGLVAGHADGGETMKEAIIREAREEAGIRINNNDLELVLTMHRWCGDHERIDLFFTTKIWDGEIKNMEPDKCDDLSWFSLSQLPKNIIPYIRAAIDYYLKGMKYCEFGWDGQ